MSNCCCPHSEEKAPLIGAEAKDTKTDSRENEKIDGPFWRRVGLFFLFMLLGAGGGWLFASVLTQEIPYLQQTLPGKLCLATYMQAALNLSFVFVIVYFLFIRCFGALPNHIAVPGLLIFGASGCFLAAASYDIIVFGIPLMLYLCCAIAGTCGAMNMVVFYPYLTLFRGEYISAARSGSSAAQLIAAVVAVIQSPGSDTPRFSPSVYYVIFAVCMLLSLVAYYIVTTWKIGLREENHQDAYEVCNMDGSLDDCTPVKRSKFPVSSPYSPCEEDDAGLQIQMEDGQKTSLFKSGSATSLVSDMTEPAVYGAVESPASPVDREMIPISTSTRALTDFSTLTESTVGSGVSAASDASTIVAALSTKLVPEKRHQAHPWLRATLPYIITIGWVDFNTWGMISPLIPFAMENMSMDGMQNANLAMAFEMASVLMVLGDLSTIRFSIPLWVALLLFTATACVTYTCTLLPPLTITTPYPAYALVFLYGLGRFIEAHILTSVFRKVAAEIDVQHRETATRALGFLDQACTTVGTVLSTVIISRYESCGARR